MLIRDTAIFLGAILIGLATSAAAEENALPLQLSPEGGFAARVEKRDAEYVLIQPDGTPLVILSDTDIEGENASPVFQVNDFNYDGHDDLAVGISAGMVDQSFDLYLYQPNTKSFARFEIPVELTDRLNCQGFWSIELRPKDKAIFSTCRGGPRWYHDILRIEPDGSVWISEQTEVSEGDRIEWPYFARPVVNVTYDQQGDVVSEKVATEEEAGVDPEWEVPVEKLSLYTAPDAATKSQSYLIKGDQTRMLEFKSHWMKIAFKGKKQTIERWISLREAYDLAAWFIPGRTPPKGLSLEAFDYDGVDKNPDYYKNLFTLALSNKGKEEVQITQGELHLIFTGADGTSTTHKLYDMHDLTLAPNASEIIDDNAIEKHGDRYVLFHGSQEEPAYVPFFPDELLPGAYKVRVAITEPNLPEPVFTEDEREMTFPPRLPENLIKP